jgi:hypothetical protein
MVGGESKVLALSIVLLLAGSANWQVDLDGDGRKEQIVFRPQVNGSITVLRNKKSSGVVSLHAGKHENW